MGEALALFDCFFPMILKFLNSIWQSRNVVRTQDTLYIARAETLVDTIPLNEIISVAEMNDESHSLQSLKGSSISLRSTSGISDRVLMEQLNAKETLDRESKKTATKGHRPNILQIKTAPDGFNFGRTYYLKTGIDILGQTIVADLLQATKLAKARSNRKSRFIKSQETVRYFQESLVFQIFVASLIMLVRLPPHPTPSHP